MKPHDCNQITTYRFRAKKWKPRPQFPLGFYSRRPKTAPPTVSRRLRCRHREPSGPGIANPSTRRLPSWYREPSGPGIANPAAMILRIPPLLGSLVLSRVQNGPGIANPPALVSPIPQPMGGPGFLAPRIGFGAPGALTFRYPSRGS